MSDLHPMYARLRGTLAGDQPPAAVSCRHPRRQRRIVVEEQPVRASLVRVTTEIHCDGCNTVVGSETHTERRR